MNEKNKFYIFLGGSVLALLALIILGAGPLCQELQKNRRALAMEENIIALFDRQVESLNRFQDKVFAGARQLDEVESFFVNPEAPIEFLKFLEEESAKLGLGLEITPFSVSDQEFSLAFDLKFGGSVQDCFKFISRLENSPFLFQISRFTVEIIGVDQLKSAHYKGLESGSLFFSLELKAVKKI